MAYGMTLCILLAVSASVAAAQEPRVLTAWQFDRDLAGWQPNGELAETQVSGGALTTRAVSADPFLTSPLFEIPASPWQFLEVRLKADRDGTAEFYWTNTTETQYAGFSPGKSTPFRVTGDGKFHTYRLFPFWHAEKKIIRLRFDLYDGATFAVESVRIGELPDGAAGPPGTAATAGKRASAAEPFPIRLPLPPGGVDAESHPWVNLHLTVAQGDEAALLFASDAVNGLQALPFRLRANGRPHVYNIAASASPAWRGRILALGLRPPELPSARVEILSAHVSRDAEGPPAVEVAAFALAGGVHRAGLPAKVTAVLRNAGAETARNVTATLRLPDGVRLTGESVRRLPALEFLDEETLTWAVEAARPLRGTMRLEVTAEGAEPAAAAAEIAFTPRPEVPRAAYVPEPKPVPTDTLVGAYYFPGWNTASRWEPLRLFPERTPVLGHYREGDPEVMDWHIQWAVEHGISFFAFDWYWVQGGRQLEHALHDGHFHARYRRLLKFCLLWANHNPPHTSSEQDLLSVTRFWIDHYFRREEYLQVDGRPVVIIFAPSRLTQDMGAPNVATAFTRMRALCRDSGLAGLYLVACANDDASTLRRLKEEGYDAVTGYNWPRAGMGAGDGRRAPYDTLVGGYARMWRRIVETGALPLLPPISGGWDSRPWHGDAALVRSDMTPEKFRRHLEEARRLCETSPRSQVLNVALIEAWNEWGEGSYIEPHAQFGFGYLNAVRAVFGRAPQEHTDVTPVDVGLGPYDIPPPRLQTAWEFATDGDLEGWGGAMQMTAVKVAGGSLRGTSTGTDPAFFGPAMRAKASAFPAVLVRMRTSRTDTAQLFWSTATSPESEANSVRFETIGDGAFHDYRLDLSRHPQWRGLIRRLRLDPATQSGVEVELDAVRLVGS